MARGCKHGCADLPRLSRSARLAMRRRAAKCRRELIEALREAREKLLAATQEMNEFAARQRALARFAENETGGPETPELALEVGGVNSSSADSPQEGCAREDRGR